MDTGSELFCPPLHKIRAVDLKDPSYIEAIEYQTKERMKVHYTDFYVTQEEFKEIKPNHQVIKRSDKSHIKYWNKVSKREKYTNLLSKSKDDFEVEESKVSRSLFGDKELWDCSYSSSTDTEHDEEESDEEFIDVITETLTYFKYGITKNNKKLLKNVDERYSIKYEPDSTLKNDPQLIIQDKKQWKSRSFSSIYLAREEKINKAIDKYVKKHPEVEDDSSTSSEGEKETHGWVDRFYDDCYFTLSTSKFKTYQKGEQIFNSYGSRSNRFLMMHYGFMLKHNPYNSFTFRAWVEEVIPKEKRIKEIEDHPGDYEDSTQIVRWYRIIYLKEKLNYRLLEYVRSTLIDKYKGNHNNILVISNPIDLEFEILVIGCAITLLQRIQSFRYSSKTTELEETLLKKEKLPYSKRQIYTYRLEQKQQLQRNINLLQSKDLQ